MSDVPDKKIHFPVHNGWVMISELFRDKVRIRAIRIDKKKERVSDEGNQHRCQEIECAGTVRLQPKVYDISKFF